MRIEADSYLLKIDAEIARELGWTEHTELEMEINDGELVIRRPYSSNKTYSSKRSKKSKLSSSEVREWIQNTLKPGEPIKIEKVARVFDTDMETAGKVISYMAKRGDIKAEVNSEDKRKRIYTVS